MGILEIIMPERCVLCGDASPRGRYLCRRCAADAESGAPRARVLDDGTEILAAAHYQGKAADAVRRLKNRGDRRAAEYFASLMAEQYKGMGEGWDMVTFVPMLPAREEDKGFNQARMLAENFSGLTGVPLRDGLLERRGIFIHHQLGKNLRRLNAAENMSAAPGARLCGERVILIDDIATTGSTLSAYRRCLLEIGAGDVMTMAAAG